MTFKGVGLTPHCRGLASLAAEKVAARLGDLAPTRDMFADPEFEYREAVKFYQHDIDWANRMILGDSLQVGTSASRSR